MTIENPHMEKEVHLWTGPQHPGVTGNMAFEIWMSGDEIQRGITHVGYLHRGFEKLMERRKYVQAYPIVCRMCVAEPDTTEYLISAALEELGGLKDKIPPRGIWLRMLNMEMARLASLIHQTGGIGGATGMYILPNWAYNMRDLILDRFEELTGARVYHMYSSFGGVRRDLPEGFAGRMEATLQAFEERLPYIDKLLFESAVWRKRTVGTAVIPPEEVQRAGISGPAARGSGIKKDTRKDFPYLAYPELDWDVFTADGCDIYSRALVRRNEIATGCDLIRQILRKLETLDGPFAAKLPNMLSWTIPPGLTYVRAESARGEMGYVVATDGTDKMRRIHLRGASYVLAFHALENLILPGLNFADLHPTLVSLPTCPPELER